MKILFLCKELPHSKVVGGPIIVYNRIKYLSNHHEIHLLTFYNLGEEKFFPSLKKYCSRFEAVIFPSPRNFLINVYDYFFSKTPPYMLKLYSSKFKEKFDEMAKNEKYDCVIAEYSFMGQYLYGNPNIPKETLRIISVHECYTDARLKVFRVKKWSWEGIKAYLHYLRLKKYEFEMYRSVDKILTLTQKDKQILLSYASNLNVNVVPHGVDVEYFKPPPKPSTEKIICFLGNFGHEPNVDAVIYFYREIYPKIRLKIPDVKLYLVGRNPPPNVRLIAEKDLSVVVTGYVKDVRPYLWASQVMVVPIRLGGGFRGKTLEGLASGLPIVSTILGVEGLEGKNGEHYLVADNPEEFANHVVAVLEDENLHHKLSLNGRKLSEKFSWQKSVEKLEKILVKLASERMLQ